MAVSWSRERAKKHIESKFAQVETVIVTDYKRGLALENIPVNKAYRVDAAHLYVDIVNLDDMLSSTDKEGETCHKRVLRFLNLHMRATQRVLDDAEVERVDFHNQRLHAFVPKPYGADSVATRVNKAVAVGNALIEVLNRTGETDQHIENAKLRVGIDTGLTLAVNNGRQGNREPLFLGSAANHAAKVSCHSKAQGIFLTNAARAAILLDEVDSPEKTKLTKQEIADCIASSGLDLDIDSIVEAWHQDLKKNPIGAFEFSAATPPLKSLAIESLSPGNSRRQDAVALYADLDGFTKYVSDNIEDNPEDVVRVLHVVRSELERVLTVDFEGRRIRYVGDCLHGIIAVGTASNTDSKETISTTVLCAGGLHDSFKLSIEVLEDHNCEVGELGLQIGFEYGPVATTRLGMKADMIRCSVSRCTREAERQQGRCADNQTSIGQNAHNVASQGVQDLFSNNRIAEDLSYNSAVETLEDQGDNVAKAALRSAMEREPPSTQVSVNIQVKPYVSR
jgi:class 3 adenylate cyclase